LDAISFSSRGHLGCAASHVHVLEFFLFQSTLPLLMIIEDDFELLPSYQAALQSMNVFLETEMNFDMLLLGGGNIIYAQEEKKYARKIQSAQETVGYIVTRKGATKLYKLWKHDLHELDNDHLKEHPYCIDQSWKQIQQQGSSYILNHLLCKQRFNFSDIEHMLK